MSKTHLRFSVPILTLIAIVAIASIAACSKAGSATLDPLRNADVLAEQQAVVTANRKLDESIERAIDHAPVEPRPATQAPARSPNPPRPLTFRLSGGPTQLVEFVTDAPIETIRGQTHDIAGRIAFDAEHLGEGVNVHVEVPVATLETGIDLRDTHMRGDAWLDARKFPKITFDLESLRAAPGILEPARTSTLTLDGRLTMHGITRPLHIEGASVTWLPHEPAFDQMGLHKDLLRVRASWTVLLSDFGVHVPDHLIGKKVSNEVSITIALSGALE